MPELPKLSIDISKTVVFLAVFCVVGVLVALGKVDASWLEKLLLILIPSPIRDDSKPQLENKQ